jgi:hypothetical protein
MSSLLSSYSSSKVTLMSVYPVSWVPGSLNGCLPFFSVQNNTLYFRADDPNIYGINFAGGLTTLPSIYYGTDSSPVRIGNKGRNFYSAPWAIPTLPAKDTGKRVEVTSVDPSIYTYIQTFYKLLTTDPQTPNTLNVNLQNFQLVKTGWAKQYQITNAKQNVNKNGTLYFGGNTNGPQAISLGGVAELSRVTSPNLSSTLNYYYNGESLPTWQQSYNTFYALDTPVVISAVDVNNNNTTIYFSLENPVQVYNNLM